MSCTGYVITYARCPVIWCSKLQTERTLSTTEAEYNVLSQVIHDVIPFISLMKEVSFISDIHIPKSEVFCKVSKYNQSFNAVADSFFSAGNKKKLY